MCNGISTKSRSAIGSYVFVLKPWWREWQNESKSSSIAKLLNWSCLQHIFANDIWWLKWKQTFLFFDSFYPNLLMSGEDFDPKINKTFFYQASHIIYHFVLNFKEIKNYIGAFIITSSVFELQPIANLFWVINII